MSKFLIILKMQPNKTAFYKKWPMLILTAMELERPETQSVFRDYIVKHYPGIAVEEVLRQVGKWPDYL